MSFGVPGLGHRPGTALAYGRPPPGARDFAGLRAPGAKINRYIRSTVETSTTLRSSFVEIPLVHDARHKKTAEIKSQAVSLADYAHTKTYRKHYSGTVPLGESVDAHY